MTIVVCPHCHRVKYYGKNKEVIWVKLCRCEENALDEIAISEPLLLMVGGLEELDETCDECILIEQN